MYFWGSPIELSKQDKIKRLRDWMINEGTVQDRAVSALSNDVTVSAIDKNTCAGTRAICSAICCASFRSSMGSKSRDSANSSTMTRYCSGVAARSAS